MGELDSMQPENINEPAEEFNSTPRQLRSHVLVFRFDVDGLLLGMGIIPKRKNLPPKARGKRNIGVPCYCINFRLRTGKALKTLCFQGSFLFSQTLDHHSDHN